MVVHVSMMLFLLLALGVLQTTQAVCDCGPEWTVQQCSVQFECPPPKSFQEVIPSAPAKDWTVYFVEGNQLGLEVIFTSPQDNYHLAREFDVRVMARDYPTGFNECFRVKLDPSTRLEANQTFNLRCLNTPDLIPRQRFNIEIQPYPTDPGHTNRKSYDYLMPGCKTIGSVGALCDNYDNPEAWLSKYIKAVPDSCGGTCVQVFFDTFPWNNDRLISTYRISICRVDTGCQNSKMVDCTETLEAGIPMCNTTFYNLDPGMYQARQQIDQITNNGLLIIGAEVKETNFDIKDPGVPEIISIPKDITRHVSASNESVSVLWEPPKVSNYDPSKVNLSSNYAPGDNFTVGVWTVTYRAEDYFKHRTDKASFTISIVGPPAPPGHSASPIGFKDNHKLMIGGIAGGASALVLLLFILILKKKSKNLFKRNSDEGSVSSDGRPSQTPTESTDPTINDRGNLVKNSQVIHGSYDNGPCFPDGSGSQYPTYDDEEFKNVVDKVSLNGHVFGPTQPNHYVNTNQYMPKVTVNCNITAGPNHFDGEQQTAWVSTCVENEPRLRSIEPEPVVHIKKDFGYGRLDSCDSGIGEHGEYPSTDIQSITQVSFTDEL